MRQIKDAIEDVALVLFLLVLLGATAQAADNPKPPTKAAEQRTLGFDNVGQITKLLFEVKETQQGVECHITLIYESGEERSKLVAVRKTYKLALKDCGAEIDQIESAYRAAHKVSR